MQEKISPKAVVLEIRPGTGGEEAALFAANLLEMYTRFAQRNNWAVEVVSLQKTSLGGLKEGIIKIKSPEAYEKLLWEGGVHRVQRIPITEKGGRIHTSTATVAVLPEITHPEEIKIAPQDLRIDVFRASGKGGQHVNVTDSAVRITHLPTGLVVSCQDERSQHKNREKALNILKAKLLHFQRLQGIKELSQLRREQIGTAERSEKIRTYNFPQNRVTDHRINKSWQDLENIMKGSLEKIIRSLTKNLKKDFKR